jgi:hypothetical protein
VDGETVPVEDIDAISVAHDLAAFVAALQKLILRVGHRAAASLSPSETRRSATGSRGSTVTQELPRSGSARSGRRLGTARLSGTTATSMLATGLFGTDAFAL